MCGRFHIDITEPEWRDIIYEVQRRNPGETVKQGDVCPTDKTPVIVARGGRATPGLLAWGYDKPAGAKGVIINARAETVTERPMFASDFMQRRCLIPASGFYEWSRDKTKYLYRKPRGLLYLGGFYRTRGGKSTFVILTKEATPPVSAVHDRIPVIIDGADAEYWLTDPRFAGGALAKPYAAELYALQV